MLSIQSIEETLDRTKTDADIFLTTGKSYLERQAVGFRILSKLDLISKSIKDKMSLDTENERYIKDY